MNKIADALESRKDALAKSLGVQFKETPYTFWMPRIVWTLIEK
jgi:hypothetical protein